MWKVGPIKIRGFPRIKLSFQRKTILANDNLLLEILTTKFSCDSFYSSDNNSFITFLDF